MTDNYDNRRTDDNVIFIGGKPFMNYVTGVVMQFTTNNATEVDIKARGKFISKAVDVAEVASKRFLKDQNISVKNIKIDSEEFVNKEGRKVNVSTLDITLSKKQA
jgi:archaea-specific DNA-binding protein